jgi:nicotinamide-nucleotide amidase
MVEQRGGFLASAESCTGGTIAQRITAIPGCSAWFKGGVVAYSNEIKSSVLGVASRTLQTHGAVSGETIEEMVKGAQKTFSADYAVATSGIAGPDGGTAEKPVGTVWMAAAGPGFLVKNKFTFGNNRRTNISRSTAAAFNMLRLAMLKHS